MCSAHRAAPILILEPPVLLSRDRRYCHPSPIDGHAAVHWFRAEGVLVPRNPMVGSLVACCCVRATTGHATAAPRAE